MYQLNRSELLPSGNIFRRKRKGKTQEELDNEACGLVSKLKADVEKLTDYLTAAIASKRDDWHLYDEVIDDVRKFWELYAFERHNTMSLTHFDNVAKPRDGELDWKLSVNTGDISAQLDALETRLKSDLPTLPTSCDDKWEIIHELEKWTDFWTDYKSFERFAGKTYNEARKGLKTIHTFREAIANLPEIVLNHSAAKIAARKEESGHEAICEAAGMPAKIDGFKPGAYNAMRENIRWVLYAPEKFTLQQIAVEYAGDVYGLNDKVLIGHDVFVRSPTKRS